MVNMAFRDKLLPIAANPRVIPTKSPGNLGGNLGGLFFFDDFFLCEIKP